MKCFAPVATLLLAIFIVVPAPKASAQVTVVQRMDSTPGNAAGWTTFFFTRSWELLIFNAQDRSRVDVEVGGPIWSNDRWSLSADLAYWPEDEKYFFIPVVRYNQPVGTATFRTSLAYYQPLNNGPHITFMPESSLTWGIGNGTDIGLAATMWRTENESWPISFGPTVRFNAGETRVKVNYTPLCVNGHITNDSNHKLRVEFTRSF